MKKTQILSLLTLAALAPGIAHAHPGHVHTGDVFSHGLAVTLTALACGGITACVAVLRARARARARVASDSAAS